MPLRQSLNGLATRLSAHAANPAMDPRLHQRGARGFRQWTGKTGQHSTRQDDIWQEMHRQRVAPRDQPAQTTVRRGWIAGRFIINATSAKRIENEVGFVKRLSPEGV